MCPAFWRWSQPVYISAGEQPEIINSRTRFQIVPVWEMVVFFLNGLIFILIGLQLPEILENLSGQSLFKLCWQAALTN